MDKKVDFSKYPEGFDAMCELADFLPDDPKVRAAYIDGVIGTMLSL